MTPNIPQKITNYFKSFEFGVYDEEGGTCFSVPAEEKNLRFLSAKNCLEYWALMGRLGEENPELNFEAIKAILQEIADLKEGNVKPFVFNRPRTR
ncbi:MAG: hypothetical protein HQM12_18230 [SAR324 cluster bacterium]|nr:hypothetical protein [SAR324 cluster bacterium]